jgi:hypothetical protein
VSRPRRRVDRKAYNRCRAQLDGTKGADTALVRSIDTAPRHFAQSNRARHRDAPPAAVNGANDTHVDIPVNGNLPAIPASQPITAHRGGPPTRVSRGGWPAADRLEIIDLFWRIGAAPLGGGVRHDG